MTSETRTTIQLSDFKAIEFECVLCHSRIVRPIGAWLSPLLACPDCGATWEHFKETIRFLAQTISQMAKTSAIDEPETESPFIVRFEIAQPKPKE